MEESVPNPVSALLTRDHVHDVTEEFEDEVEVCIDIAHNRSLPVPIAHAVACRYGDQEFIEVLLVVDVNGDVLEHVPLVTIAFDDDSSLDEVTETAALKVRETQQDIWGRVTNTYE